MSSISASTDGGYQHYQKSLSELEDDLSAQAKKSRDSYEKRATDLEKSYDVAIDKQTEASEDALHRSREHAQNAIARDRKMANADVDEARNQLYDKYGKLAQENMARRRDDSETLQKMAQTYEADTHQMEEESQAARNRNERSQALKMKEETASLNRSHSNETAELRNKLGALIDGERAYVKEKGQGTADAERRVEEDARNRERFIQDGFSAELSGVKRQSGEAEENQIQKQELARREQDRFFSDTVAKRDQAHAGQVLDLKHGFDKAMQEEQDLDAWHQKGAVESQDRQFKVSNEQSLNALKSQGQTYQATMRRQSEEQKQQLARLEEQLGHRDSGNPTDVNPAVAEKIRQGVAAQYDRSLKANVARTNAETESMQRSFNSQNHAALAEGRSQKTQAYKEFNTLRQLDRSEYLNHVEEMARTHQMQINDKDAEVNRRLDTIRQGYTLVLDQQKRESDRQLQQSREDAIIKLTAAHQEADSQLRLNHQEMVMQNNQLVRDYEKKLQDQKAIHDDETEELKTQLARDRNDSERRSRQLSDEQSRLYEQKIAQMEFQSKERERMITESYQDQLDKMKRAHALQQQPKKS